MDKPYTLSGCFCCVLLVCVPLSSAGMWRFNHNVHNPLSWNFAQLLILVTNILWISKFYHIISSVMIFHHMLFKKKILELLWNMTYITNILCLILPLCFHCGLTKHLCLCLSGVLFSDRLCEVTIIPSSTTYFYPSVLGIQQKMMFWTNLTTLFISIESYSGNSLSEK